ncbi:PPE family protein [Mycobacterium vicinigordonae]|uniref:PPE family protein n=1 Tax=Mycobacterium vicinigordonae TaxID=1719132 RepID=A0A7D6DZU0_9MYCO|nr:PPE family protein [Mycobacterium vicinigordonae]QLL08687.1 PPE family protein [Mycobacterium vicinigordonae]
MSFFTLPPEINSLRMFLGAGSAPMLEAAAAWDGLAAELGTAAQSFGSVISNLAGQAWQGPAAAAMAAAAAPYAGWLAAAASQSLGAAGQARSVVSAFEAARAATVHPGAVDANRNAFVNLVMTNLFGQNAPLIAMAESIYEEMWAADVTAMTGYYAGAAAAAAQVVPWQTVLQSFPALTGGLAGAVAGAAGAGAGAGGGAAGSATNGATAGGAPPAAGAAGGGEASSAGGVGSADPGLAPAAYAGGDPAAYTAGNAVAPADAGAVAATTVNTGVVSPGGFSMMPMAMGGIAMAGLLGDRPSMPSQSQESAKSKEPAQSEESAGKPEEAVTTEETAESQAAETLENLEAEVPAMSVLPSAAPDVAAAAAPSVVAAVAPASAISETSRIPVSSLRATGAKPAGKESEDSESGEAEASVVRLRPEIEPGQFHQPQAQPEAEAEAEEKIRLRG